MIRPDPWSEVANLTANQTLVASRVHGPQRRVSRLACRHASVNALEMLAEAASSFRGLDGVDALISTADVVAPGESVTFAVAVNEADLAGASLVSMLIDTNDAFTGFTGINLVGVTGSSTWMLPAYDSGTELNDELAASVPGLTGAAAGYDGARDDHSNFVRIHAGVLSVHDLSSSALVAGHRFDNPVAQVTVSRRS